MSRNIVIPLEIVIDEHNDEVYVGDFSSVPSRLDLRRMKFEVQHPTADGAEPASLILSPKEVEFSPIDEDKFLSELERAEAHFSEGGYVSAHYFLSKWRARGFDTDVFKRRAILKRLEKDGRVRVYRTEDGVAAIRTNRR